LFIGGGPRVLEFVTGKAPRDVLFIHGAGGNHLFWSRTLALLEGGGRAVAVDLPGHPSGSITCKTIPDYADVVNDHLTEQFPAGAVVCGHSMGSAIALTLALDYPEEVSGLILIGAGAKLGVDPTIVEGLRTRPMKTIEQVITPMSYFKIDLGVGREARAALSFSNLPVFLNDYLACDGFDVRSRLREISVRTLLVCGEDDKMTPPKWSDYLEKNIPSSELAMVKEAGHMVPLEKPEACARLVQKFLTEFSP